LPRSHSSYAILNVFLIELLEWKIPALMIDIDRNDNKYRYL